MKDKITYSNKRGLIFTIQEHCIGCNRCIRGCPVLAANIAVNIDGESKIEVNPDFCIHCGNCFNYCQHEARDYIDDTERFFRDLSKGEKISLIVAPSIRTNFSNNFNKLFGYLKEKGVRFIYDTSLGADIATWIYTNNIKENEKWEAISQACPVIVNYVEKIRPDLISYLSEYHSPMMCTAIYMNEYEGIKDKLAFLSPCIAKKDEIDDPGTRNYIQYNVTFQKLDQYLTKNNIDIEEFKDEEFDSTTSGMGKIFSRPGGLRENLEHYKKDVWIKQIEGEKKAFAYLDKYENRKKENKPVPTIVDILNCREGCNSGTGTKKAFESDDFDFILNNQKKSFQNQDSEKLVKSEDNLMNHFDKIFTVSSFKRNYLSKKLEFEIPTQEDMDLAFTSLKKYSDSDKSINCWSCGYNTCYEMATAIALGINNSDNCLDYNRISKNLCESEMRYQILLANLHELVIVHDEGKIIYINDAVKDMVGYTLDEMMGMNIFYYVKKEDRKLAIRNMNKAKSGQKVEKYEIEIVRKDGNEITVVVQAEEIIYNDKPVTMTVLTDVTDYKNMVLACEENNLEISALYKECTFSQAELNSKFDQLAEQKLILEESEERYRLAFHGANDILWDWDIVNHQVFVSTKYSKIFGSDEFIKSEKQCFINIHPDDIGEANALLQELLKGKNYSLQLECRMNVVNKGWQWFSIKGKLLRDISKKPVRIAGAITNISEYKKKEEQNQDLPYYEL
jgi:PAS domain S-box-containing protein